MGWLLRGLKSAATATVVVSPADLEASRHPLLGRTRRVWCCYTGDRITNAHPHPSGNCVLLRSGLCVHASFTSQMPHPPVGHAGIVIVRVGGVGWGGEGRKLLRQVSSVLVLFPEGSLLPGRGVHASRTRECHAHHCMSAAKGLGVGTAEKGGPKRETSGYLIARSHPSLHLV